MYSLAQIQALLKQHQRRLRAGDALPTIVEIANRAGIHRDTIYAVLNGDRACGRTQYALSRVLQEIEVETAQLPKTKLMSVTFKNGSAGLQIGHGKIGRAHV